MIIHRLRLRNFRNYGEAELDFGQASNQFFGDNAQGKSNLIEALYLAITGRSFRGANLQEMIRQGTEAFFIEVSFERNEISHHLSIGYDGCERLLTHNGTQYKTLTPLLGLLHGVVLSEEDRQLISGAPAYRRRFLDLHLAQIDPSYVDALARYTRAMRQRNGLLRSKDPSTLDVFEEQMTDAAHIIYEKRLAAIEELATGSTKSYDKLANEKLSIRYRPSPLNFQREREMLLGYTTSGPHRDDFQIFLDDNEVRTYGSEGQKSCAALALRLTEYERLKYRSHETPLLLVDDMGVHLDQTRKEALTRTLGSAGQTFLANPEPIQCDRRFLIRAGTCEKEELLTDRAHPATSLVAPGRH